MSAPDIILVCGVQGSGKSWVCRQLAAKYRYIAHDRCWSHPDAQPKARQGSAGGDELDAKWGPPGSKSTHVPVLLAAAARNGRTIITEVPFNERGVRDELTRAGLRVEVVFVVEEPDVIAKRYRLREGKEIQPGALTRAAGLADRARQWGAFSGSSAEVLARLKR